MIHRDAFLLADGGYPGGGQLRIPYNQKYCQRSPLLRQYSQMQRRRRIIVEHVFGRIKKFSALSIKWRHRRFFQPIVVNLVAQLYNRKRRMNFI